ncbi:MAG: hypothetical protein ABI383_07630 [Acidobacteriaceae bacterium]
MNTVKAEARAMIDNLPDDATIDDIQYHLYELEKLRQGSQAIAEGRFYTQDEVERMVEGWITK